MPHEIQRNLRARRLTLLAVLALVAAPLSGCGGAMSEEQKDAMRHVQSLGGKINLKSGGYEIDLSRTAVADADLAYIPKIANVKIVAISETQISDAGLAHLHTITSLTAVSLKQTNVTSVGIEQLRQRLPNVLVE